MSQSKQRCRCIRKWFRGDLHLFFFLIIIAFTGLFYFLHAPAPEIPSPTTPTSLPFGNVADGFHLLQYKIAACSCSKSIKSLYPDFSILKASNKSLPISRCSDEATLLGPGQRVVSYTLFLDPATQKLEVDLHPKILYDMAWINLQSVREHYPPGWVVRLHTNAQVGPFDDLCKLACENPDFLLCNISTIPRYGDLSAMMYMTWRDLPLGDPTVQEFAVRDLDAFILSREAEVVKDWLLHTDSAVHVMRDKRHSHNSPILGGMWGASNARLGERKAQELGRRLLQWAKKSPSKHTHDANFDQQLLVKLIYEPCKALIVAYDSYHCEKYRSDTMVRPFPVQRMGRWDVVGAPFAFPYRLIVCPESCRPGHRLDWVHC